MQRLPWPLPALLVWAAAWAVFASSSLVLPWWGAALLAGALGLLASVLGHSWWRRAMMAMGFPLSWLALSAGQLPAWAWLIPLLLLLLLYPVNAWRDAPVFPTPAGALDGLSRQLALPAGARVLDAGCGMGHGLQALHSAWPQAQVHGVERSWPLRWISQLRCPWARVCHGDMWASDWSAYALVYVFQRPESMSRAAVKALGEMPEGSWLVSLNFPVPDVEPSEVVALADGREVYAYRMPWAEVDHERVAADVVQGLLAASPSGMVVNGQSLYPTRGRPGGSPKHRG